MRPCPYCKSGENTLRIKEKEFLIVRCTACGLTYLLNPPEESEIYEDYYQIEFKGNDYREDSSFEHLREIFEINEQRTGLIKKFASLTDDFKLLDIGCGSGLFLKSCKDAGIQGEGIDVSNNALDFARNEFGLDVYNRTTEDLINEGKKYDLITMWHVLEHILNPIEELRKIKELLSLNGYLMVEVPNLNSIKFKLSGNKWKGGNHPLYHRSFFTSKTLGETLIKSGFTDVRRIKFSYPLSNKSFVYNLLKIIFNVFSADAFLNFTARNTND
ncbi:MAG: class I SAM-dependent methyltransferase [Ignavibacteria bacterium]